MVIERSACVAMTRCVPASVSRESCGSREKTRELIVDTVLGVVGLVEIGASIVHLPEHAPSVSRDRPIQGQAEWKGLIRHMQKLVTS